METKLTNLTHQQNETSCETLLPRMVQPAFPRGQNIRVKPTALQGQPCAIFPQPSRPDSRIAQRPARHNGHAARPDQRREPVL